MNSDSKEVKPIKKNPKQNRKIHQKQLEERLIQISRVSKVTKGGKKLSFRAIVVIGDENGQVGVGVAKADDVINAFKKAAMEKSFYEILDAKSDNYSAVPQTMNRKPLDTGKEVVLLLAWLT